MKNINLENFENQVVISSSNVEVPTCSDYEANRLELYNDYNSVFLISAKKTLNNCSSYQRNQSSHR